MFDDEFKALTKDNISLLVPWYLTSSYAYYVLNENLLSDEVYDQLCKDLLTHYKEIEHHHKYLVEKAQLKAGTGYALPYHKFPQRITSATMYQVKLMHSTDNTEQLELNLT